MVVGILVLMIIAGVIAGFAARSAIEARFVQAGPSEADQQITIAPGTGLSKLAGQLESDGLIRSATMLKLKARMSDIGGAIKVGEYNVPAGASMADIIDIVSSGKTLQYPLTAPEGRTTAQILRTVQAAEHLIGEITLTPAEGTLLPETYMSPKGMSRDALIQKMMDDQTALLDRLWPRRAKDLPIKTKAEAIILASVVEKETGIGGERAEVAGVFTNRLRRGMRLQSDPTIIYGISKGEILRGRDGKQRGLRRSEIDRKTDWNTYQIDGLPKTPICNPGEEAIAAVLNPAQTQNLYFVADGTGGHVFAKSLREHNNNVLKWRRIERNRRAGR